MPRAKPFTCRRCGEQYVTARCPHCYPAKRRSRVGGRRSGSGSRRVVRPDLGRVLGIGVNVDALPDIDEGRDAT